ncbi:hypothetical protein BaRGS_00019969 [Batillaria attramentaria]|uniref:Fatty acyl-CoA reductase n=1 Tax=Batillaria attramentaria TaxID=370345 RepID=A0ABD0KNT4_9CAEN
MEQLENHTHQTPVDNKTKMSPTHHHHADSTEVKSLYRGELTVPKFYACKKILVTGATGFMGKVLVEKLLRCCPDLDCIYCLIRPKNNQDVQERINELTDSKLFDKLRKEQPDFEQKVVPVCGDVMLPDLGISESDRQMLEDGINIVFHSAATVRFDETLRVAVNMNVVAVQKLVKLCKEFKHLEAFVHVSTAYANCDYSHIEETVYTPPVEPQKIIDVLEPSIVGATWKEPFPGWIDNYNGPSGLYIATGKGILRSMKGESSAVADIVPVDIPINLMITVAWYTAIARPRQLMVYHATTSKLNPFTWGEMEIVVLEAFKRTPLDDCFRRPKAHMTNNSFLHDCFLFVSHMIPAYMADVGYRVVGKKPRMVRIYKKLHRSLDSLTFFTCNSWTWANNNAEMLVHQLTPEDHKMFYFDPRPLHWPTYMENYCLGAKKYLLNEDLAGLPAARAHIKMLRNIRYMFNTLIAVVLWRTLIARSQIARNLWYLIVSLASKFVQYFRITSTM